jgi:gliding motility-associated lipoprotein GldH
MKTASLSSLTVAVAMLFSCAGDAVYNRSQPVRNGVWEKQAEYYFKFKITDASVPYSIFLQIRNSDRYGYQNLWLLCEELQPGSASVKDTMECMLADDFGRWKGRGITLFHNRFTLRDHYFFPDTGQYTIGIRHGMRDDNLTGIEDIGLSIEKAQNHAPAFP